MDISSGVVHLAMKDRLCALAHELNNSLAAIAGHCELVVEHLEPGSECEKRVRQILLIAHTAAKRLNGHECRIASLLAQDTVDLEDVLFSIQDSTQPSQPAIVPTSKSAPRRSSR